MYVIAQSAGGKNTSTSLLEPVNILKTKKKRHNSSKTVTCDITQKKPLFSKERGEKANDLSAAAFFLLASFFRCF